MVLAEVIATLSSNPYFGAGFGLLGVGTLLAGARKAARQGIVLARRRALVSVEVSSRDRSYQWLMTWMSKNLPTTQHVSINTQLERLDDGAVRTRFEFVPSVGNHMVNYNGTWIHVRRDREKSAVDLHGGGVWESITMTMLGRNRGALAALLDEARAGALANELDRTVLYTSFGPEWRQFGPARRRRPLHSVILPEGVTERVLADVRDFLDSSRWYNDRGIPYRRGYLLTGPPGCGKSSFIQGVAGELQHGICILSLADRSLTDDRLVHLLTVAPERTLIVLEDIDSAFHHPTDAPSLSRDMFSAGATFSGLLNAIDGIAASEGRILLMTTNHPERLDPALIRPGRVDMRIVLEQATSSQVRRMFVHFYSTPVTVREHVDVEEDAEVIAESGVTLAAEEIEEMAVAFASKVPADSVSMADLQGYLMLHKHSPHTALAEVSAWAARPHHHRATL